jgi:hypothetical protein
MDELKNNFDKIAEPPSVSIKKQYSRFLRVIIPSSLIIIAVLASLPYAYSYYQKNTSAQLSQHRVQKQLDHLLSYPDVVEYAWMRSLNPIAKAIEGSIVWSQAEHNGVMKFKNLPATSKKQQYHLRIYDRNTTEAFSTAVFQQGKFMKNARIVAFKANSKVKSPYKFILSLESIQDIEEEQILLRAQP